MQSLLKFFGTSVASLGMFAFIGTVYAADTSTARAGYNVRGLNRSGVTQTTASQRMPTMPTLPINTVGNLSPDLPTSSSNSSGGGGNNNPGTPDNPNQECPDGGVRNSDYTVDTCMNDVLACINNGALPNGLNDMFNEDLRNSIVNGMGLCSVQVERCIREVRKDCKNVYSSASDVWIDFNARKVQPEYYSFVLRRTGLTPNQAENTCLLLDRNTYGSSFTAVSNTGAVTEEYNNTVGAYNSQNGNILVKTNPQGVNVNTGNTGVDGQRGHYARWDPTTAECLIRVAAYNKDTQIKNSWLFGAVGNDQLAEVWKAAGETFTCNKDLFGFTLMNQTNTAAVVGIGGGAVVGVGVGALAGHGKRAFDCANEKHREMLTEELRTNGTMGTISNYMENKITVTTSNDMENKNSATTSLISPEQCEEVVLLYDKLTQLESAIELCDGEWGQTESTTTSTFTQVVSVEFKELDCSDYGSDIAKCIATNAKTECADKGISDLAACNAELKRIAKEQQAKALAAAQQQAENGAAENGTGDKKCYFSTLNLEKAKGEGIYCPAGAEDEECLPAPDIEKEMDRLRPVFTDEIVDLIQNGEASNMGKSIGIGAAVGAGAGGLATAITAFVERSNINCRVGDGLVQIGLNKSYTIGSLKDFYVKWNLSLPDTISPTALVVDCDSWKRACGTLTDLNQCNAAQINYRPAGATQTALITGACTASGSVCIENYPVARSYGACE